MFSLRAYDLLEIRKPYRNCELVENMTLHTSNWISKSEVKKGQRSRSLVKIGWKHVNVSCDIQCESKKIPPTVF